MGSHANRCTIFFLSCFLIFFGFPGQSVGICALTDSILRTTGLSRNLFSTIYMGATLTGCLLVLVAGPAVDRFGLRRSVLCLLLIWGMVLASFGGVKFSCAGNAMGFVALFYAHLSLLRFLGQNMFPMVGRLRLMAAFGHRQGMAISLCNIIIAIASNCTPPLMHFLAMDHGWQGAYLVLAAVCFAALVVFVPLFQDGRSPTPEENGAEGGMGSVDGSGHSQKDPGKKMPLAAVATADGKSIPMGRLVRMPIFWYVMVPLCLNACIGSGTTVHIVDIFRENGLDERLAIGSYGYLGCATIVASLIFGHHVDKNRVRGCVIALLLLQFFGLVGLETSGSALGFWTYVLCIGGSWGGYGVLMATAFAKIFRGYGLGAIFGTAHAFSSIAGAIGVPAMSFFRTGFGSYFYFTHALEGIMACTLFFVIWKFPRSG